MTSRFGRIANNLRRHGLPESGRYASQLLRVGCGRGLEAFVDFDFFGAGLDSDAVLFGDHARAGEGQIVVAGGEALEAVLARAVGGGAGFDFGVFVEELDRGAAERRAVGVGDIAPDGGGGRGWRWRGMRRSRLSFRR